MMRVDRTALTIGRVGAESAHLLAHLVLDAFSDSPERGLGEAELASLLGNPAVWGYLFQDNQGPVGFCLAQRVHPEVEILSIGIVSDRKNQGYGLMLLRELLKLWKAEGAEICFLEVRLSNHYARNLYERLGFIATGRREKYYRLTSKTLEDAVCYRLKMYTED